MIRQSQGDPMKAFLGLLEKDTLSFLLQGC